MLPLLAAFAAFDLALEPLLDVVRGMVEKVVDLEPSVYLIDEAHFRERLAELAALPWPLRCQFYVQGVAQERVAVLVRD